MVEKQASSGIAESRESWDAKWAAYQDFIGRYPQHGNTWPSFYAGTLAAERIRGKE